MKIKFTANISPQTSKGLSRYKKLLLDIIEDDSLEFCNYLGKKDGSYIITVKKEHGSYIIYWEEFSGMYLKYKPSLGLHIGYKFNQDEYINFFISEKYQNEHIDLMDENIALWTNDMKSFPLSPYVTKHKTLLPYIYWSPHEPCLPDYMYLEISLKKDNDNIDVIKKFYNCNLNIKKIASLIKLLKK